MVLLRWERTTRAGRCRMASLGPQLWWLGLFLCSVLHPSGGESPGSKGVTAEAPRLLEAQAQNSHNVTYATFYWSKQVTLAYLNITGEEIDHLWMRIAVKKLWPFLIYQIAYLLSVSPSGMQDSWRQGVCYLLQCLVYCLAFIRYSINICWMSNWPLIWHCFSKCSSSFLGSSEYYSVSQCPSKSGIQKGKQNSR